MPQAHQLPYWLLTARCPKHGEMRAAVSYAALVETIVCGKCDATLDVKKNGRAANGHPWRHVKDELAAATKAAIDKAAQKKPTKRAPKPAPELHARTLRCVRCKGEFQHVPNPHGGRTPFYCPGCREEPRPGRAPKPVPTAAAAAPPVERAATDRVPIVTPQNIVKRADIKRASGRLTFHAAAECDDPLLNVKLSVDADVFAMPRERFEALAAGVASIRAALDVPR